MFENYKWLFPSGAIKNYGINNNIETFKDNPIPSLGREICQNSGDVRKKIDEPVLVEFKSFKLKTDDFPDIDGFRFAIDRCIDFWKSQNNPKASAFFSTAKKTIDADQITILRISDHNTLGLGGADKPDDTNANWTSLVMSSGTSTKSGTEGGSFGIGKFAAFANSKIRTVFYSTVDSDKKQASQGISYLASFYDENNKKTFGEGFCGNNTSPLFRQIELDPCYHRSNGDSGTDIYICGFSDAPGWKSKLVAAVLDGFLFAIMEEMLIVQIDDIRIDKKNLDDVIKKYKDYCQKETYDYYEVLQSENEWIILDDFDGNKNSLNLKLLIKPGLNRRVAMVRKTGMKILDQGGFSSNILFSGFMYISGNEANKYLTSLENPAHTGWFFERDDQNPDHAKKYLADIRRKIRNELDKLISTNFSGEVIPEMGNLLQSINKDKGNTQESEILSNTPLEIKPKPRKTSNTYTDVTDDPAGGDDDEGTYGGKDFGDDNESNGSGGFGNGQGGSGNKGSHEGDNSDGSHAGSHKKTSNKLIPLSVRRSIAKDVQNGSYLIKIIPTVSIDSGTIEIVVSAEDGVYSSDIIDFSVDNQSAAVLNHGKITNVVFTKDKPLTINLHIDSSDYTSFEVRCYETETE